MKNKLNVVDVFIILAVFLSLLGIVVRIFVNGAIENADMKEYKITVIAKGVSGDNLNMVRVGDSVSLKEDGIVLGEVEYVKHEEHKTHVVNSDNLYTEVVDSEKLDITMTVKVIGKMTGDGFMLNGSKYLSSGMNVTFETENFESRVVIMDISTEK